MQDVWIPRFILIDFEKSLGLTKKKKGKLKLIDRFKIIN